MIKSDGPCIQIKDPTNKAADWQSFKFDKIFEKHALQTQVFSSVFNYDYMQFNSLILDYGQSGAGKSYTIFGTPQQPGLLPQMVSTILQGNQLTASFQEIYIDQVTDLASNLITEELTSKPIKELQDIWDIIKIIQKVDIKRQVRTHLIVSLNINQQTTMQFVDLAGSERVAKNLQEGQKYQEAIMVNASHTVLGKCLSTLHQTPNRALPINDSKLTKLLQLTPLTQIALIGHVNPSESNFEECLSTLQFMDRTKNIQVGLRKQGSMLDDRTPLNASQEKAIKKLMEEVESLKLKIEQMDVDKKKRFLELQKILQLDVDLEKLTAKNAKDIGKFKSQAEALLKVQSLEEILSEKDEHITSMEQEIKLLKLEDNRKQERLSLLTLETREMVKKLKDQIQVNKMSADDSIRQLAVEREQIVKKMIENSNLLLEDKVSSILNLPQAAQTKNAENQKLQEVRRLTKIEVEKEFTKLLDNIKVENNKYLESCKVQYEQLLCQKNDEIENFIQQFKQYRQKKKTQISELAEELLDLYDIVTKQAKCIEKIELGGYSGGLKSFNIPKQDKPNLPNKAKHQNLFKFLDNRSCNNSITKKGSVMDKTVKTATKQFRSSQSHRDMISEIDTSQLDALNFSMMDLTTLRSYANRLKEAIKEQHESFIGQIDKLKQQIIVIQKEKDDLNQKFNMEMRKFNQTKVVIESQNRLLSKVRPLSSVQHQRKH